MITQKVESPNFKSKAQMFFDEEKASLVVPDELSDEEKLEQSEKYSGKLSLTTGRLLVIIAAAIYGSNFAVVKLVDEVVPLEWSALARFGLAAIVCLALKPSTLAKQNRKAMFGGMEVGFWYFVGYTFQSYGLETISAGKNSFYNALAVLVVPFLDAAIKGTKITTKQITSMLLAIGGVGILQLGGGEASSSSAPLFVLDFGIGDALSLGQTICFGIGYWKLGSVSSKYGDKADIITVGQLVAVAIGFLCYAFSVGTVPTSANVMSWISDPHVVGAILWTAMISTALAIYMETVALKVISAAELTIIMTSISIWGSFWAFIFLGEFPTKALAVGGSLILLACLIPSLNGIEDKLEQIGSTTCTKLKMLIFRSSTMQKLR